MRKYQLPVAYTLTALLLLNGCGIYTVFYSNYDRSTDFSKYRTFAWLPDENSSADTPYDNDIIRNNTKNYFNFCFTQRAFIVKVDEPDLLLQLVLLNEEKEEIVSVPDYSAPAYYQNNSNYYPYYYPDSQNYTDYSYSGGYDYSSSISYKDEVVNYVKRTITLNVIDRKTDKLVWTGTTEGDIYDPAYIQYDVHPALHKLIKRFPVKPVEAK